MKKVLEIAILVMILCVGWSQTTTSSSINDLGTINYNSYLEVEIVSTSEVNLSFVHSTINQSAIVVSKLSFIPVTNTTRYLFTSMLYVPEYWEQLDQELFVFQDDNSLGLYSISIDMSNVVVPDDPWMVMYLDRTDDYFNALSNYNQTRDNLTVAQGELDELLVLYNLTFTELNTTLIQNSNLTSLIENKTSEVNALINDLNVTKTILTNMTNQATTFRTFYEEMTSYKSNFNFKLAGDNEQYTTIYEYEMQTERLGNSVKGFPLLIIFSLIVTIVLCLMLGYWKWGRHRSSPEEIEMLSGADPEVTRINRFKSTFKHLPKDIKIKQTKPLATSQIIPEKTVEKPEEINKPEMKPETTENNYEKLQKEVDQKLQGFEIKMDSNHKAIMDQIKQVMNIQKTSAPK